jgi:hypothetical protein
MPDTWGGRSTFNHVGSVETGTQITYGQGHTIEVSAQQYSALRQNFLNRVVPAAHRGPRRPVKKVLARGSRLMSHLQQSPRT